MNDKFQYLVASKGEFMAVTLIGTINATAEEQLGELYKEIQNLKPHFVVLNFRDVGDVDRVSHRMLTMIQKLVRADLKGEIRSCGIAPKILRDLEHEGVLRANEVCDNVWAAIDLFLQMRSK